jgi:hypothetical protein
VPFLCLFPSFAELQRDVPNADLVINGFEASCESHPTQNCYLTPRVKQVLGMPVSQDEIEEAQGLADAIPGFSIDERLSPDGLWGPQIRTLPHLPTDTPGDLWSYGEQP